MSIENLLSFFLRLLHVLLPSDMNRFNNEPAAPSRRSGLLWQVAGETTGLPKLHFRREAPRLLGARIPAKAPRSRFMQDVANLRPAGNWGASEAPMRLRYTRPSPGTTCMREQCASFFVGSQASGEGTAGKLASHGAGAPKGTGGSACSAVSTFAIFHLPASFSRYMIWTSFRSR
jgi:hypothetical protein